MARNALVAPLVAVCAFPLVGCTEARVRYEETLPAAGLSEVHVESERGLVRYDGRGPSDAVDATAVSWARGASRRGIDRKLAANDWELQITEGVLWGAAVSGAQRAGVDLILEGPATVHTDIVVYDGEIELVGVHGIHVVTADRVVAEDLHGEVDLFAGRFGLEAEVYPDPGGFNLVQSYNDDLTLRLPPDGDYTIEVFGDARFGMVIRDLGFHEIYELPDYFYGVSGSGETVIQAFVGGGAFYLFAAPELEGR